MANNFELDRYLPMSNILRMKIIDTTHYLFHKLCSIFFRKISSGCDLIHKFSTFTYSKKEFKLIDSDQILSLVNKNIFSYKSLTLERCSNFCHQYSFHEPSQYLDDPILITYKFSWCLTREHKILTSVLRSSSDLFFDFSYSSSSKVLAFAWWEPSDFY